MTKRRLPRVGAIGLVAAAAAVVAVLVAAALLQGPREGGPLAGTPAFGYAITSEPGGAITDALTVLKVASGSEGRVALLEVEQVFSDSGLSSAGEWVSGSDRSHEAAVVEQFYREAPPTDPRLGTIHPVEGATAGSRDAWGLQLLLGVNIVEEGHHLRRGMWVTYTYLGETYRDFVPAMLTICTPGALAPDGTCPFLGQEDS